MATAADLLQSATGVPRSDALLLLAKLLGVAKERLIAHPETVVSEKTQATFSDWIERVRGGFPTTYLLGTQSFWGRDFIVTPDVLIPRPDTETVIETVLHLVDSQKPFSILDLGTGSGAIAVTLAKELPSARVTATDISDRALAVAKENARRLGATISFSLGNWFESLPGHHQYNIIVSNPPYIRPDDTHLKTLRFEPRGALTDGVDGLMCIRTLIAGAAPYLVSGGVLLLEHGYDQACTVRALFNQDGWYEPAETVKDLAGNDRVTYARKRLC